MTRRLLSYLMIVSILFVLTSCAMLSSEKSDEGERKETVKEETVYTKQSTLQDGDTHLQPTDVNYKYYVAYKKHDLRELTKEEAKVYSAATKIIWDASKMTTNYEKEVDVYQKLMTHIEYDENAGEEIYTAYGALVNKKAVCQGYAMAFKLCMDLLEIDCITIGGTANQGEEEISHAWNMVNIEDAWYNVDITWDDTSRTDGIDNSFVHLNASDQYFLNHKFALVLEGLEKQHIAKNSKAKPLATAIEYFKYHYDKSFAMNIAEFEEVFERYASNQTTTFYIDYFPGSFIKEVIDLSKISTPVTYDVSIQEINGHTLYCFKRE